MGVPRYSLWNVVRHKETHHTRDSRGEFECGITFFLWFQFPPLFKVKLKVSGTVYNKTLVTTWVFCESTSQIAEMRVI